jgi:hypothetical protein
MRPLPTTHDPRVRAFLTTPLGLSLSRLYLGQGVHPGYITAQREAKEREQARQQAAARRREERQRAETEARWATKATAKTEKRAAALARKTWEDLAGLVWSSASTPGNRGVVSQQALTSSLVGSYLYPFYQWLCDDTYPPRYASVVITA